MQTDMTGKVALVTGGAGGIGEFICERLAQAGSTVLMLDVDGSKVYGSDRKDGWLDAFHRYACPLPGGATRPRATGQNPLRKMFCSGACL